MAEVFMDFNRIIVEIDDDSDAIYTVIVLTTNNNNINNMDIKEAEDYCESFHDESKPASDVNTEIEEVEHFANPHKMDVNLRHIIWILMQRWHKWKILMTGFLYYARQSCGEEVQK